MKSIERRRRAIRAAASVTRGRGWPAAGTLASLALGCVLGLAGCAESTSGGQSGAFEDSEQAGEAPEDVPGEVPTDIPSPGGEGRAPDSETAGDSASGPTDGSNEPAESDTAPSPSDSEMVDSSTNGSDADEAEEDVAEARPNPDGTEGEGGAEEEGGGTEVEIGCLQRNGTPCVEDADCNIDSWGTICVKGECHEMDFINEAAMECCQEAYANGEFAVVGCNPWGPSAPPSFSPEMEALLLDALSAQETSPC